MLIISAYIRAPSRASLIIALSLPPICRNFFLTSSAFSRASLNFLEDGTLSSQTSDASAEEVMGPQLEGSHSSCLDILCLEAHVDVPPLRLPSADNSGEPLDFFLFADMPDRVFSATSTSIEPSSSVLLLSVISPP